MRYFGVIVFGAAMVISMLAALWLSYGAGAEPGIATVMGIAVSPFFYMIFTGPFAILFVLALIRSRRK
jgi:hypothetical protein